MSKLEDMLTRHEGCSLKPYVDSVGKETIGIGRCLEDVGISKDEALYLLKNDITRCQLEANSFPWFKTIDDTRQDVVVSMIFNLGLGGFSKFKKMIDAIAANDFKTAAKEMLQSAWAKQVGKRAYELSEMMRTGSY